jgi:transcriptional regulator with XRE-family HTH domain
VRKIQHINVILAKRLREAMEKRYPHLPNDTQRIAKLAKEADVGRGTIQRALDPETHGATSTGVDKLDKMAKALRVEAAWLLTDPD